MGDIIGMALGRIMAMGVDDKGRVQGEGFRIVVMLDISKALWKGIRLRIEGSAEP